jgi:hypothetical protein
MTVNSQICGGKETPFVKQGQNFYNAIDYPRKAPQPFMNRRIRGIHAYPEIPQWTRNYRFNKGEHLFRSGGLSAAGKHITVGTTAKKGNPQLCSVTKQGENRLLIDKRFPAGKGHRVNTVYGALLQRFFDNFRRNSAAFYGGVFAHAALGAGPVAVIGYLNNQLTGQTGRPGKKRLAQFRKKAAPSKPPVHEAAFQRRP